jgi:hypothetical protein
LMKMVWRSVDVFPVALRWVQVSTPNTLEHLKEN